MNRFREVIGGDELVLTAELPLSPQMNRTDILNMAEQLAPHVDAIQVPDHTNARPHISNMTVANLLLQHEIDPIVHMNSRDRNRISLQSDLLSAQALGITSVLLMRGSDLPPDHRPRATSVFDVGAIDFITTAAAVRDGEALINARDEDASPFQIGAIAQVFDPRPGWKPEKLHAKTNAGANFIQLPLCMNVELLERYMKQLIGEKLLWKAQVMVTLACFTSFEQALETKERLPDSVIGEAVFNRLGDADDPAQEGQAICIDLLHSLSQIPGISGANLLVLDDTQPVINTIQGYKT